MHNSEVVSSHSGFHLKMEGAFRYGERKLDPKSERVCPGRNTGRTFRLGLATPHRNGAAKWSANKSINDAGGCGAPEGPHPAEFSSHGGSGNVRRQPLV